MCCERCDQADRRPVKRAKLAERDGRVAVVLERSAGSVPPGKVPGTQSHVGYSTITGRPQLTLGHSVVAAALERGAGRL